MSYRAFGRLYALAAAVATWAALALQFQLVTAPYGAEGRWSIAAIAAFLASYATLTDVLAALSLTVAVAGSPRAPWPSLMSAIAVYLAIDFGLHHFFGGDVHAQARERVAEIALNCVTPGLFALYWFLFVPKGHAPWFAPLVWPIYPAVLLAAALWHGDATGISTYAFLDAAKLGFAQVTRNCAALLATFVLAGIVFRALDRLFRPLAMA